MRIRTKILLSVFLSSFFIFSGIIASISYSYYRDTLEEAKRVTDGLGKEYANLLAAKFRSDMSVVRTLAQSFKGYKYIESDTRDSIYSEMIRNVLVPNKDYLAVWISWELNATMEGYTAPYGRRRVLWYRNYIPLLQKSGNILNYIDTVNLEGDTPGSIYTDVKNNPSDLITSPYRDGRNGDTILVMSIGTPIMDENKFVGLIGNDLALTNFNEINKKIKPYKNSFAFIISNEGRIIAHKDSLLINEKISNYIPDLDTVYDISGHISRGEKLSFINKDKNGKNWYHSYVPVNSGKTNNNWSLCIVSPTEEMLEGFVSRFYINIIALGAGLILLFILTTILSHNISRPLIRISNLLRKLNKGNSKELHLLANKQKAEIGQIAHSASVLIDWLNHTGEFAKRIGKGELNAEYKLLNENDLLGQSLLDMRDKMLQAKQKEEITEEKNRRLNWITAGIAKFVTVLRHSDTIEQLSENSISTLIEYMDVVQGAFFVVDDSDPEKILIKLVAGYGNSFEKQKKIIFKSDEGLIGRCYSEAKTIYKEDLPDNFVTINSGLGTSKPLSILIVPLQYNQKIYGVVEVAAFGEIEKYKIDFVERVGESIAMEIQNTKNSVETTKLLAESREKSIELKKKELESREKNEEMIKNHKKLEESKKQLEEQNRKIEKIRLEHSATMKQIVEKQIKKFKDKEIALKARIKELEEIMNDEL